MEKTRSESELSLRLNKLADNLVALKTKLTKALEGNNSDLIKKLNYQIKCCERGFGKLQEKINRHKI